MRYLWICFLLLFNNATASTVPFHGRDIERRSLTSSRSTPNLRPTYLSGQRYEGNRTFLATSRSTPDVEGAVLLSRKLPDEVITAVYAESPRPPSIPRQRSVSRQRAVLQQPLVPPRPSSAQRTPAMTRQVSTPAMQRSSRSVSRTPPVPPAPTPPRQSSVPPATRRQGSVQRQPAAVRHGERMNKGEILYHGHDQRPKAAHYTAGLDYKPLFVGNPFKAPITMRELSHISSLVRKTIPSDSTSSSSSSEEPFQPLDSPNQSIATRSTASTGFPSFPNTPSSVVSLAESLDTTMDGSSTCSKEPQEVVVEVGPEEYMTMQKRLKALDFNKLAEKSYGIAVCGEERSRKGVSEFLSRDTKPRRYLNDKLGQQVHTHRGVLIEGDSDTLSYLSELPVARLESDSTPTGLDSAKVNKLSYTSFDREIDNSLDYVIQSRRFGVYKPFASWREFDDDLFLRQDVCLVPYDASESKHSDQESFLEAVRWVAYMRARSGYPYRRGLKIVLVQRNHDIGSGEKVWRNLKAAACVRAGVEECGEVSPLKKFLSTTDYVAREHLKPFLAETPVLSEPHRELEGKCGLVIKLDSRVSEQARQDALTKLLGFLKESEETDLSERVRSLTLGPVQRRNEDDEAVYRGSQTASELRRRSYTK